MFLSGKAGRWHSLSKDKRYDFCVTFLRYDYVFTFYDLRFYDYVFFFFYVFALRFATVLFVCFILFVCVFVPVKQTRLKTANI